MRSFDDINDCPNIKPFYYDQMVAHDDVKFPYRVRTVDEAAELIDTIPIGSYLSIPNINDLSQVHIYRRVEFNETTPEPAIWDGESTDVSWYDAKKKMLLVTTAAQLRGLHDLVAKGITFEGQEVRLGNNIDLGYHEWDPIGKMYQIHSSKNTSKHMYSKYDISIDIQHAFQGTFNGAGHIIYGLSIRKKPKDGNFHGFFLALEKATVKNVIFGYVNLSTVDSNTSFAAVTGVAENTIFSNIRVTGVISCSKPSGVCGIAIDSIFYECKNAARLIARTTQCVGLIAGGICQQITLSKQTIKDLKGKSPVIFKNCLNEGSIEMDGNNAKYLWAGHFFGGTFYKRDVANFSFTIEKCKISDDCRISVRNGDEVEGESVFYGYLDNNANQSNYIGATTKDDLLSGLIGRVDQYVDITVVRTTMSTIIDNMVVSGTVNTLHSEIGDKTFSTIDAEPITSDDCIYDLEPFFKYVKTVKI